MERTRCKGLSIMDFDLRSVVSSATHGRDCVDSFIEKYEPESLRTSLLEFAIDVEIDDDLQSFVCLTFDRLGLGHVRDQLREIIDDEAGSLRARLLAFEVLFRNGDFGDSAQLDGLNPELLHEFHAHKLRVLLRSIARDPNHAECVDDLFRCLKQDDTIIALFLRLESLRREVRVPACFVYYHVLLNSTHSSLSELALDAIEKEGGIVARSVLESIRYQTETEHIRHALQRALDCWHYPSRQLSEANGLTSWISCPDTFGVISLRFKWQRKSGRVDVATFRLHATAGLENIELALDRSAKSWVMEYEERSDEHEWVEIPSGVGASIIMNSREARLANGLDYILGAEATCARLETVMCEAPGMSLALAAPINCTEVGTLLATEPYRSWKRAYAGKVDVRELRARLELMIQWHRFQGQRREAEIVAILVQKSELAQKIFSLEETQFDAVWADLTGHVTSEASSS